MAFDFPASPANGQVYGIYTWNGTAWVMGGVSGGPGTPGDYVLKTGDFMTGYLTLSAEPVQPLHAATKQYVDQRMPPLGGTTGEALVKNTANMPQWAAPADGGSF